MGEYIVLKEHTDDILCVGCLKTDAYGKCSVYEKPSVWARKGGCPMKTNVILEAKDGKKINPIKKSKRRNR